MALPSIQALTFKPRVNPDEKRRVKVKIYPIVLLILWNLGFGLLRKVPEHGYPARSKALPICAVFWKGGEGSGVLAGFP
jgi:hypothetical protein